MIHAGTWRSPEKFVVTEPELRAMPFAELQLLERMVREKPSNVNIKAWMESGKDLPYPQVVVLVGPDVPCVTTLGRRKE
jgi:hypothetical protein